MKQLNWQWLKALDSKEKQILGLGGITFAIGVFILFQTLIPLSWVGRAEAKGEILKTNSVKGGSFGGGSAEFAIGFQTHEAQSVEGIFKASPTVLSVMKTIRVFYKKQNPSDFYVYDPSKRIIGIASLIFGMGILGAYIAYLLEKKK